MLSRSITFTAADGGSITFDTGRASSYIFGSINGVGTSAVSIFSTTAPGMHGAWREEALYEPREISFNGYVTHDPALRGDDGRRAMDKNLKQLSRVLGQLSSDLTVTYRNTAGSYLIGGTLSGQTEYGARERHQGRHYTPVAISVTCCRPLWYETEWQTQQLRYNSRGLRFPLVLPTSLGVGGYRKTVRNDSAAVVPLQFDIIGPAATPTITNVTRGTSMSLTRPLLAGERLIINTDPDSTSVTYFDVYGNEISALGYINTEAGGDFEFTQLYPGENVITFESGDDLKNATVVMRWRQSFTGV